jgi:hypothetical protein
MQQNQNPDPFIFLIPVATVVAVGAFLSVVGFARERRREREALYRHETARALVEKGAMTTEQFHAFLREEAMRPLRARLENVKLFGLVTALAGVGLMIGMRAADEAPARGMGWLPLGLGAGALVYAYVLARREP